MASSTPTPPIPDAPLDDERPRALLVTVGVQTYAWSVSEVREVLRPQPLTTIPRAPALVLGLMNVRGLVVTVLDLPTLLARETEHHTGAPPAVQGDDADPSRDAPTVPRRAGLGASVVLLEHRGRAVGVTVDAVLGVVPLDETRDGDPTVRHGARLRIADRDVIGLEADRLLAPVMLMAEEER
ncbi:MAG: chemotaxis protein CheW [Gemmatimonadaceae bacterium]|nr:chemotaxis protein CheW [Gemmatimonadaceae bacterium]